MTRRRHPAFRTPHSASGRAFTIIEVLIALAVFSMMAVGLIGAYLNVLGGYERIKTRPKLDLDVRFARNALLAEADFETAQKGDQFEGATGRHVTWTSVIEPTTTANLFLVTFTCVLSAGNNPGEREETITETFRLLRPTWASTSGFTPDAATLRTEARDRITQAQQPSPLSGLGPTTSGGSGGTTGSGGSSGGAGKNAGGDTRGGGAGKDGARQNTGGKTTGGAPKR